LQAKGILARFSTGYTALALAFFLTGCAAISPQSRMGEAGAPGAWSATKEAQAGIDRRWVGKIGGSELRSLVDQAVSNNLDLKAVNGVSSIRVNQGVFRFIF
jgi:hypothetical protein